MSCADFIILFLVCNTYSLFFQTAEGNLSEEIDMETVDSQEEGHIQVTDTDTSDHDPPHTYCEVKNDAPSTNGNICLTQFKLRYQR